MRGEENCMLRASEYVMKVEASKMTFYGEAVVDGRVGRCQVIREIATFGTPPNIIVVIITLYFYLK
jgi:hypothetical protein